MNERVVLSVEDSDADFYLIQLALKEAGIAIKVCRTLDGADGISFLERSGDYANAPRPDLILLNVNMPRRNGFEVLSFINHHEAVRTIPVIMFTTTSDPRERKQALALGAKAFLTKDGTLDKMIKDLSACVLNS